MIPGEQSLFRLDDILQSLFLQKASSMDGCVGEGPTTTVLPSALILIKYLVKCNVDN